MSFFFVKLKAGNPTFLKQRCCSFSNVRGTWSKLLGECLLNISVGSVEILSCKLRVSLMAACNLQKQLASQEGKIWHGLARDVATSWVTQTVHWYNSFTKDGTCWKAWWHPHNKDLSNTFVSLFNVFLAVPKPLMPALGWLPSMQSCRHADQRSWWFS